MSASTTFTSRKRRPSTEAARPSTVATPAFSSNENITSAAQEVAGGQPQDYVWDHVQEYDEEDAYKVRVLSRDHLHLTTCLHMAIKQRVKTAIIRVVRVLVNTSVLETHLITQKIGMIPLQSRDVTHLVDADSCSCYQLHKQQLTQFAAEDTSMPHAPFAERLLHSKAIVESEPGCSHCSVKFILSVRNDNPPDSGASGEIRQVTCRDLRRVAFHSNSQGNLTNPSIQPIPVADYLDPIPICKLRRGQEIHAVLYAKRGNANGLFKGKYDPTTTMATTYPNRVMISRKYLNACSPEQKQELVESCPYGLFSYDKSINRMQVHNDTKQCIACQSCVKWAVQKDMPELIRFEEDRSKITISMGLTGALTGPEIMIRGFEAVDAMLAEVQQQWEEL